MGVKWAALISPRNGHIPCLVSAIIYAVFYSACFPKTTPRIPFLLMSLRFKLVAPLRTSCCCCCCKYRCQQVWMKVKQLLCDDVNALSVSQNVFCRRGSACLLQHPNSTTSRTATKWGGIHLILWINFPTCSVSIYSIFPFPPYLNWINERASTSCSRWSRVESIEFSAAMATICCCEKGVWTKRFDHNCCHLGERPLYEGWKRGWAKWGETKCHSCFRGRKASQLRAREFTQPCEREHRLWTINQSNRVVFFFH